VDPPNCAPSCDNDYTESNEAYQNYLKGRFYWNKRNAEAFKKSIEYFNQAIERDPSFAQAYAGLADTYALLPFYSVSLPQESYPKAKAAAKKALEIDDTLAEAHASLAHALFQYDWNLPESNREFQRAIELNSNYATAHQWYGWNLSVMGRFDEAIAEGKRAHELDPLSMIINADLGSVYIFARQYDQSIEQLRKTIELDQSFYYAHWRLGMAYEMKGSLQEAITEYQKARQLSEDTQMLALLAHAFAASGKRDEALRTLDQLKEISKQRYVPAYGFAIVYEALGDKDQAFQWLERSYQDRAVAMSVLKVDPLLDNLRSDPRFADLVRRVGLP
jgi:tetratricopeptide (TPR) repeat protein